MKKTVLVKEIVEAFDDYLKDVSKGLLKDNSTTFFYTDGFDEEDLINAKAYRYKKKKVSESKLLNLKEKDLKDVYDKINSKYSQHGYNLSISGLLFRKMYECYENYKAGNIRLSDKVEVVEDIFGCDKYSDKYLINTMDKLFGKCMAAISNISYGKDCFIYFPYSIEEDYFSWDEDIEDFNVEAKEARDYDEMISAAARYLENNYYNLNEFHYDIGSFGYGSWEDWNEIYYSLKVIDDKFLRRDSPNYVYEGLNGLDVYDFGIGLDEDNDHKWRDEAENLLYDFWTVRHKCMKILCLITKIEKGETDGIDKNTIEWYNNAELMGIGFRSKYDELSLNDFKMSDDGKLKIINNQEIYSSFGVDKKYIEKHSIEHEEEYDYEYER